MKFLIAASFLCIALVGQAQGGSLHGLSVRVPHQQYGVPLLGSDGNQAEEIKQPSGGDQQSAIINDLLKQPTTSRPFIGHLPLIDSAANFLNPSSASGSANEPVTQKPELPLLQPGIPSLPAAPVVPAQEPAIQTQEFVPSNSYLPPRGQGSPSKQELPIFQLPQPIQLESPNLPLPILQLIQAGSNFSNTLLPSRPSASIVPNLPGFPSLPSFPGLSQFIVQSAAASLNPLPIFKPFQTSQQFSNEYQPQSVEFVPLQSGLPALPEAPKVPVNMPIHQAQPALPILEAGLPALPEAPVVPLTPIAIEQPSQPPQPELLNTYLPPKPELPLLQPGLPALPEAPKIPFNIPIQAQQPITEAPVVPLTPVAIQQTYLPPSQPELPLLQPGLPALPEAPKIPFNNPIQAQQSIPEASVVPLTPVATQQTYLPPQPQLPLLQPGLPALPEAPNVPINSPLVQLIPAQPSLPSLPSGLPALPQAPIVPLNIEQPSNVMFVEEQQPILIQTPELPSKPESNEQIQPQSVSIVEYPALPEAPVIPASIQTETSEDSKIGYEYEKPATQFIQTVQVPTASQAPIVQDQNNQVAPGQAAIQAPWQPFLHFEQLNIYPASFANLGPNTPIQTIQPIQQIQPIHSVQPIQPIHSAQQIQQIQPIHSVQPIQQIQPIHSVQPIQQIQPIHTVQPIQPIHSVQPIQPIESIQSVQQIQSVQPIQQIQSVQPIQQIQSIQTIQPVQQFAAELPPQQQQIVLPAQQVLLQPQNGYTYSPPSQQLLLPNQH